MDDMVRLCFEDFGRVSLVFGNNNTHANNKINGVKEELVVDVDLFDAYEGEELPKDKKNLAFHIIYQAKNRTLKSEEVDKTQDKIIKALEENPGWQVRK